MRVRGLLPGFLALFLASPPLRADGPPPGPPAAPAVPAAPPIPAASSAKPFQRGIRVLADVAYAQVDGRSLTLDLYLPETEPKAPLPLLVWVHGGGWIGGDKRPCPSTGFVPTGWIVASVGYRLTTVAPFPAQIHDVKAAIRFLRAHADAWGIDPERVAAAGASAGGHLVALLGTSGGVASLEGTAGPTGVSSAVQAVIDYFGPTDLTQFDGHGSRLVAAAPGSVVERLLGGPLAERGEVAKAANPITFVDADDPPFLIFHGDRDDIVPLDQSRILVAALKKAGVSVTLVVVPGGGHGFPGTEVRAAQFLREQLGTPRPRPGAPRATTEPPASPPGSEPPPAIPSPGPEPAGMGSSR